MLTKRMIGLLLAENKTEIENSENDGKIEEAQEAALVTKQKHKELFQTGIIMAIASVVGIVAIILISLFSTAAGDITVIYMSQRKEKRKGEK